MSFLFHDDLPGSSTKVHCGARPNYQAVPDDRLFPTSLISGLPKKRQAGGD